MARKRNRTLAKQVVAEIGACEACGMAKGTQAHHRRPLYKGGEDVRENLICLCDTCHFAAPESAEEFEVYRELGGAKCKYMFMGYLLRAAEGTGCVTAEDLQRAALTLSAMRWLAPGSVQERAARMVEAARQEADLRTVIRIIDAPEE